MPSYRQSDDVNAGTRRIQRGGRDYLVRFNKAGAPLRITVEYERRTSYRTIQRILWDHQSAKSIPDSIASIIKEAQP